MNFSQRVGLEPAIKTFQKDSMTRELRTSLWNVFAENNSGSPCIRALWVDFLKWPVGPFNFFAESSKLQIEGWFLNAKNTPWNKVYDFLEFVADHRAEMLPSSGAARRRSKRPPPPDPFIIACNAVLEREFSAYRFVGTRIVPLTSDEEIKGVDAAASMNGSLLRPAAMHIEAALKLLSDRANPDYRNSMKEAISAVEAICKVLAQNEKTTLGPALDAVKAKVALHSKLHEAFKALYSYSSDAHGIRHALKDDAEPEAEDAKFFLVSCSAFVNYLVEKARKQGLLPT